VKKGGFGINREEMEIEGGGTRKGDGLGEVNSLSRERGRKAFNRTGGRCELKYQAPRRNGLGQTIN